MGKFPLWDSVSVSLKWRLSSHIHELELWTICMNPFSGLPWWLRNRLQCGRPGLDPWVGKIPWRRGMTTHTRILDWRVPMDRGAWWATVHGVTKTERRSTHIFRIIVYYSEIMQYFVFLCVLEKQVNGTQRHVLREKIEVNRGWCLLREKKELLEVSLWRWLYSQTPGPICPPLIWEFQPLCSYRNSQGFSQILCMNSYLLFHMGSDSCSVQPILSEVSDDTTQKVSENETKRSTQT